MLLESYTKEIENLQAELRIKEEDNTQRDLLEMHEDIKLLNDTIESLQYENTKLKDAMLSLNQQTVEDNKNKGQKMEEIDILLKKIHSLDTSLKEREKQAQEAEGFKYLISENEDLKKEKELIEESLKKIGEDNVKLINEFNELDKLYDCKESDYRRQTQNYDELHKRFRVSE